MQRFTELFLGTSFSNFAFGSIQIDWPWPFFLVAAIAIAVGVFLLQRVTGFARAAGTRNVAIWFVRSALLTLVLFVLLRPSIQVETTEPVPGSVMVLIDDSTSMNIADDGSTRRADTVAEFFAEDGIGNELAARYGISIKTLSGTRLDPKTAVALDYSANESPLGDALADIVINNEAEPVSSVVLISDGGDSSDEGLSTTLNALAAAGVAVHTLGVGAENLSPDFEITDIQIPTVILAGDTTDATVTMTNTSSTIRHDTLTVQSGGALVGEVDVQVPANGAVSVRVPLALPDAGTHRLVFLTGTEENEAIYENNQVVRHVSVSDERIDVLHFEGEPRFEVKFLRRALRDETNMSLRSLVRTAENKYYRLGVDDEKELSGGFPEERSELYRYRVLVLGSANAELLDEKRQAMIRDFVAERGGGLLLLGSANSFAEGGFSGTTLAEVMPVELADRAATFRRELKVQPSAQMQDHPLARITGVEGPAGFERLPALTVVNPLTRIKPGANVILDAPREGDDSLIILASHRYGRGTVATLAVRDSWRWQINADITPDDTTHETLMRQLIRWLARPVPTRLELTATPPIAPVGKAIELSAWTLNEDYAPAAVSAAGLTATVTSPSGSVREISLNRGQQAGSYTAGFVADEAGRFDIEIDGRNFGGITARTHVDVSQEGLELVSASLDRALLERIADRTEGLYFSSGQSLDALVDSVGAKRKLRTVNRRVELWRAPLFLLLLLGLLIMDLVLRRSRTLA